MSKRSPLKVLGAILLIVFVVPMLCMCPLAILLSEMNERMGLEPRTSSRPASPPDATDVPELDPEALWVAIEAVEIYEDVYQANVDQDGKTLKLLLVVESRGMAAREQGANFVRAVASFADPVADPGLEIGPTLYDYEVRVTNLNGDTLFVGHKPADADEVSWD